MSVSGNQQRGVVIAASGATSFSYGNGAGSWVQAIASTTSAILITCVFATNGTSVAITGSTVSIATGAAASEVTIWSGVVSFGGTNVSGGMSFPLAYPIRVPTGTRVAVQITGANSCTVGFTYVNESAVL